MPPVVPSTAAATGSARNRGRGDVSPDLDAMLRLMHLACSTAIWDVHSLRSNQCKACNHLADPNKPNELLLVDRTGGGKTHVTRVVGAIEKGITLVVINLHTLSADQMAKFEGANQEYGTVESFNVDELFSLVPAKYKALLERARRLQRNTTSTLFLFCSPQFLVHHPEFIDVLDAKSLDSVLRLVVFDEIHLHVQQGISFRREIRQLKPLFFDKLFARSRGGIRPKVIFATGTLYKSYVQIISNLTTIGLPPEAIIWSPAQDFQQRNIDMDFKCTAEYTRNLDTVVSYVQENNSHSVCVFVSSKQQSFHMLKELESKLNAVYSNTDVIHVHGSLDKKEKYWFIRIFCSNIQVEDLCARILLATPAANVGIDNHNVRLVVNLGWPRDLLTYFQQRGRAGRVLEQLCKCLQLGSIKSFVNIMFQIYHSKDKAELDEDVDEAATLEGMNSAITPLKKKKQRHSKKRGSVHDLSTTMKRALKMRQRRELHDVLRFFCLNFGCQHVRAECFLSSGKLNTPLPCQPLPDIDECKTMCCICKGSWNQIFLPVDRKKIVRMLKSKHFLSKLPLPAEGDNIVDILWSGPEKWRVEEIYRKKTVQKQNVVALFLQLTASKILELKPDGNELLKWHIGSTVDPQDCRETLDNYEFDSYWAGINCFKE